MTAGKSCQVTDGAVALLVMQDQRAESLALEPLGTIRGRWTRLRALKATGMRLSDMELIELNEAFAAQVVACLRAFASGGAGSESRLDDSPAGKESDLLQQDDEIVHVTADVLCQDLKRSITGARP